MRAKDKIGASRRPLLRALLAICAREQLASRVGCPHGIDIKQVGEEIVCEFAWVLGQDAVGRAIVVRVQCTQAANEHCQLRSCKRQLLGLVDEELLCTSERPAGTVAEISEPIRLRIEELEAGDVGVILSGVDATDSEWHLHIVVASIGGCLFDGGISAKNDEVGKRDLLFVGLVEVALDFIQLSPVVSFNERKNVGDRRRRQNLQQTVLFVVAEDCLPARKPEAVKQFEHHWHLRACRHRGRSMQSPKQQIPGLKQLTHGRRGFFP